MDTRNNPIIIDGRTDTRFGGRSTSTTSSLLGQVLMITSVGFLTSAVGVYIAPPYLPQGATLICFLLTLGLIFGIRAARNTPVLSFALFLLLTLAMGFEISPWINYLLHTGQTDVVFNAAITTAVGMGSIGIIAQLVSFNYRRVGNIALGALLALILAGVVGMLFHMHFMPGLYSWAALAIFTVLLLVDFMRIKDNGAGATAIELSVSFYLDGLNIFLALTQIFSGGGRRR
jgi:FtsH-binding integral membrane protein